MRGARPTQNQRKTDYCPAHLFINGEKLETEQNKTKSTCRNGKKREKERIRERRRKSREDWGRRMKRR